MVVKWSNGGPERIIASINGIEERLIEAGTAIMEKTVAEGAEDQAKALDEAETDWGRERYYFGTGAKNPNGRGNSAGRNDTGNMIDEITYGVERHNNSIIGFWGWDNPDPHDAEYFAIQEATAQSLHTSFTPTRERFFGRVRRLIRGR